jgi:hypothetical protein
MNKITFLVVLFCIAFSINSGAQNRDIREKLRSLITEYGQADVAVPYTTREEVDNLSHRLSVYSVNNRKVYLTVSPFDIDLFLSLNQEFEIIENKGLSELDSASGVDQAMEWDTYPTYTQYDSIMRKFTVLYPSLCRLDTIGISGYGKLVLALKISDNVLQDENEPEVFYTSSMHGDETGGYVLMLHLIDYLLKNYNTLPRARNLIDNLEIWINPLANPDGTYRTGNTIISPIRYNSKGFDLNRSFPDPLDASIVVPDENKDMIRFMRKHHFIISANFHAGAEVVNYPWDRYLYKFHADDIWFNSISRAYADTVHNYSTPAYMNFMDNGVTRGAVWYKVYGGRQDFVTSELQGREVTIELDDIKTTPAAQLGLLWMYNSSSLMGYLENAYYGIYGLVRDSATLKPVQAKVFITGHDMDSSHVYSDTLSGTFVRMLAPGSYNITYSAKGYKTETVTNVEVFKNQRTDITVNLAEDLTGIEPRVYKKAEFYPNPASDYLTVILPDDLKGNIKAEILTVAGTHISEFTFYHPTGEKTQIDISSLKNGAYLLKFSSGDTGVLTVLKFLVVK